MVNTRRHFIRPNLTEDNQVPDRNFYNPYENVNLLGHSAYGAHHLNNPVQEQTKKLSSRQFLQTRRFNMDEAQREAEEFEEEEEDDTEEVVTEKPPSKKTKNNKPTKPSQNKKPEQEEEVEVTEKPKSESKAKSTKPDNKKKSGKKNNARKDNEKTEFRIPGRARSFQGASPRSPVSRNSRGHFQTSIFQKPSNSMMHGARGMRPMPSSMMPASNSRFQPSHFQSFNSMPSQMYGDPLQLRSPFGRHS